MSRCSEILALALILCVLGAPGVSAAYGPYTQTSFNNSQSYETIDIITKDANGTVWFEIPKNLNVTSATFTVRGNCSASNCSAYYEIADMVLANSSIEFGPNWQNDHNQSQVLDNSLSTYGMHIGDQNPNAYVNHTTDQGTDYIIDGVVYTRAGTGSSLCTAYYNKNVTLTDACVTDDGNIKLRTQSRNDYGLGGSYGFYYYCYNAATGATTLMDNCFNSFSPNEPRIYSAVNVYWNVSNYPRNMTMRILDGDALEQNNATWINESITITINETVLTDYLRNNCTGDFDTAVCAIPINIETGYGGVYYLEDLNVSGDQIYGSYDVCLRLEDDWDEPFDMTTANATLNVYCVDGGQLNYNMSNNCTHDLEIACELSSIGARIDYGSDEYFREILAPAPEWGGEIFIYVVDALVDTILQMPIYMDDVNYREASLELYKTEGDNHYTIASGYFDVENKLLTYLKKDSRYYLRITDDGEIRDINYLYAYTATDQHIALSDITLSPTITLINDNILMTRGYANASAPETTLWIRYQDLINMTQDVRIQVSNNTESVPFYDQTFHTDNFTVSLLNTNTSFRYSIHFSVNHTVLGNSPIEFTTAIGQMGDGWDLNLPEGSEWLYTGFCFFIIMMTALVITPENRFPGYIALLAELGVMAIAQWLFYGFNLSSIALFVLFIAAGIIYEIRHGRQS